MSHIFATICILYLFFIGLALLMPGLWPAAIIIGGVTVVAGLIEVGVAIGRATSD